MQKPIIGIRFDGENIIPSVDGMDLDAVTIPTITVNISTNPLGFHHLNYQPTEEVANIVFKMLVKHFHKGK